MSQTSAALGRIQPSATLAMSARVNALKAEGVDVIGLSAGEPDFDTPDFVKEAGIEAIRKNLTRYTDVDGTADVKEAVAFKFKRDNGLIYKRSQISVNSGGKHTLFNALVATVDVGDEVIIPAPYWVSYPDIVNFAGGTPVFIEGPASQGYKITPAHQVGDAQLALQPVGRRLFGDRTQGAGRSAAASPACAGDDRRHV